MTEPQGSQWRTVAIIAVWTVAGTVNVLAALAAGTLSQAIAALLLWAAIGMLAAALITATPQAPRSTPGALAGPPVVGARCSGCGSLEVRNELCIDCGRCHLCCEVRR